LAEVDRDERSGLLPAAEAAQARAEIARRLIAASETGPAAHADRAGRSVALATAALLCLAIVGVGAALYDRMGRPDEPDQPLAERMASPSPDINILIAKAEAHLLTHPRDGKGWEVLAPIYMRQMRAAEAAAAWKNVVTYLGPTSLRYGNLGEALAAAQGGQVAADAQAAFAKALELDPKDPRARFYLALAVAQAGRFDEALASFDALLKDSPADAPWIGIVTAQVERVNAAKADKAKAPGNPDAAAIDAAAGLNDGDRAQMIRTMVETLDARLKDDPANFEGWQRLIRSYAVLNDRDKALDALKRGLAAFPPDSDNGKALIALAREVGLPTEEMVP